MALLTAAVLAVAVFAVVGCSGVRGHVMAEEAVAAATAGGPNGGLEATPTSSVWPCPPGSSIIIDARRAPPTHSCAVNPAVIGNEATQREIHRIAEQQARGEMDLWNIAGFDGPGFRTPQGTGHIVTAWSPHADRLGDWAADVLVRNDTSRPAVIRVDAHLTLADDTNAAAAGVGAIVARPGEPVPVRVYSAVPFAEVVSAEILPSVARDATPQNRSFRVYANEAKVADAARVWGIDVVSLSEEPVTVPSVFLGVVGPDGFRFVRADVHVDHTTLATGLMDAGTTVTAAVEQPLEALPGHTSDLDTVLWAYAD